MEKFSSKEDLQKLTFTRLAEFQKNLEKVLKLYR